MENDAKMEQKWEPKSMQNQKNVDIFVCYFRHVFEIVFSLKRARFRLICGAQIRRKSMQISIVFSLIFRRRDLLILDVFLTDFLLILG